MPSADIPLRNKVADFYVASAAAVCVNPGQAAAAMRKIFSRAGNSRMVDGVIFDADPSLDELAQDIARALSRRLGSKASDESALLKALWKAAARRLIDGQPEPGEAAKIFIQQIEAKANVKRRYIDINQLVVREPGIERLDIGPVTIIAGYLVADELNAGRPDQRWVAEERAPSLIIKDDGTSTIGISPNVWVIDTVAARENLTEEAAWLAGVTVSLIKIVMGFSLGPFFAEHGRVESHPFKSPTLENNSITTDEDGLATGGMSAPTKYVISAETLKLCKSNEFQEVVSQLFSPLKGSVAERVVQGLGWLARGRQSEDRAERLLFFFTAIEALLSSNDKSAPVVQNIARSAATILTDDHHGRASNAKIIKDLYAYRSAVVHGGSRDVAKRQANTAELIADKLFFRVFDQVDLTQKFAEFQNGLGVASYGSPWGDPDKHRLGSISFVLPEAKSSEATTTAQEAAGDGYT